MQKQEDSTPTLTNDQIILFSTALQAKLEYLTTMAETFNDAGDIAGVVACTLNTVNPMGLQLDFPEQERVEGDMPRNQLINKAKERIAAIQARQENIRHSNPTNDPPQPDDKTIIGIQLAATVLGGLSDAHAVDALTIIARDNTVPPALRWGALGMAQGITTEFDVDTSLATTRSEAWEITGNTGTTIMDEIETLRYHPGTCQKTVNEAGKTLCGEYGIDEPSPIMLQRPGVIKDTVLTRDSTQRYQLVTDLVPQPHDVLDGVVFNYRDVTYIKTIGEPYPRGFPYSTALNIAQDYLARCDHTREGYSHKETSEQRQEALNAMKLAQLQLHCLTTADAVQFIYRLEEALPHGSDITAHIMRLITARDNNAQDLLLRGELHTTPLTTSNGANRIIKTAKSAGLRPAALWELALLINVDPTRYGINRPTLSPQAAQELASAGREAGIPEHIIAIVQGETTPQTDQR